ncbi:22616_t:CDS:2, partial [Cetraspora pellucida]
TDKNVEFSDGVFIIQGDSMNDYDKIVKWIVNNNICSLNISEARKSNLLGTDLRVKMEIFQKMHEKCANDEMVLLKEKINMFEHNYLFERFKVKLEIETPVRYALLSVQNDISGIDELYSHELVEINNIEFSDLKKINEGEFGIISKAIWKRQSYQLEITVTIKTLKNEYDIDKFKQEVRTHDI